VEHDEFCTSWLDEVKAFAWSYTFVGVNSRARNQKGAQQIVRLFIPINLFQQRSQRRPRRWIS
jgi:hypothetical protein